jgi:hypothetical protein
MTMFPIASVTLGTAGGTVIFDNIPQNYTHLQVRITAKNVGTSGTFDYSWMMINGASTYAYHRLFGDGSSASSGGGSGSGSIYYAEFPTSTSGYANMFGTAIVDILDYTNTSKNKTIKCLYGHDQNGVGRTGLYSGFGISTAAVTYVQFNANSYNFAAGSRFDIYGITTSSVTGA